MVQIKCSNNVTGQLLTNISSLYQNKEISKKDKEELVMAIKKAVRSYDYSEFLTLLTQATRFCSFPEIVEDCKTIIAQQN